MGTVIEFPAKSIRDWNMTKAAVLDALAKGGASDEIKTRVVGELQPFFELLNASFNFSVTATIPATTILTKADADAVVAEISRQIVQNVEKHLQTYAEKLMLERTLREIRACQELGMKISQR